MAKISPSHLGLAVASFAEQEMYPQTAGLEKVLLAALIAAMPSKAAKMVEEYKPMLDLLDVWTPDGMIDLDSLYQQMQTAFAKTGTVEHKGFGFSSVDVEKLYAIARQFAQ
jgi:hypothetical protein